MLATFRNHAKGWIAWVFVILVTVPFAFWGIGQYRSLVTTDYVAKVNGEKIMPPEFQRAYQNAYQQKQKQLGDKWDPSTSEQQALKNQVLDQLIDRTVIEQQAAADRLVAGRADVQAQIEQIPAFQTGGKFSFEQYQQVLAANALTPSEFESRVRQDVTVEQLQRGIGASAFSLPREASALVQDIHQQRKVAWFFLPLARFKPSAPPADAQVKNYYQTHRKTFETPTTLTVAYVRLNQQELENRVTVTDADAQSYYETHQSQYGIPPARKAAEIVFKPKGTKPGDWMQAQVKAATVFAELQTSKDRRKEFAKMAGHYSTDPIARRNGGSIGWVGRGQMEKAFDHALFGIAKVDGIAGPVRLKDGWAVIQLLGRRGGSVKPYDEIKAQVARDARKAKATDLYYKLGDQLANIAYEHPNSLESVAKALNLKIYTLHGVTQKSGPGIANNETVRKAAFSTELLQQHENSEPIKLGPDDAVVLHVTDVRAAHPKPLKKVHDQIVAALENHEAETSALAAASAALKSLRQGKSMKLVALEYGEAAQGPVSITRNVSPLPHALTNAVFSEPPRADGRASIGKVVLKSGDQAVFALLGVSSGKNAKQQDKEKLIFSQQIEQLNAMTALSDYVAWLRSQASVKVAKENIP